MTWLRLDDRFAEHPKIVRLSAAAFRVHVRGMCYSAGNLTDGRVPMAVSTGWGRKAVAELVAAGLWIAGEGEHSIHDYLDWNPSRSDVVALKEVKSKAGAKGAAKRWDGTSYSTSHTEGDGTSHGNSIAIPSHPIPSVSKDQKTTPSARALWGEFGRVLGAEPSNENERGKWDKGLLSCRQSGLACAEVAPLVAFCRRSWPDVALWNPQACSGHIAQFRNAPAAYVTPPLPDPGDA